MVSTTYTCGVCGNVAATVTLVPPGVPDPRLTPEPSGVPPGISRVFDQSARLSIAGGPSSLTLGAKMTPELVMALESGSAAALFAIDAEFAPFWCPVCAASYCREHYRSWAVYDDGFFDCIQGVCPAGHERMLTD